MKKYFLKEDHQEVKLGDKIQISAPVNTSYGQGRAHVDVVLTEANMKKLVDDGFIVAEKGKEKIDFDSMKPYFRRFARKNEMSLPSCLMLLSLLLNTSKKAHLLMLIETIAEVKNRDLKKGDKVFWLNPAANYKPVEVVGNHNHAVVFYSLKDAIETYNLLLPFINDLDGE